MLDGITLKHPIVRCAYVLATVFSIAWQKKAQMYNEIHVTRGILYGYTTPKRFKTSIIILLLMYDL